MINPIDQPIPPIGVGDDFDLVKRWAQDRRIRYLAAQTATHAIVRDVRNRRGFEWVGTVFNRQRRTPGEPDTGVIPRAGVFIDAVSGPECAQPLLEACRLNGLDATLSFKLALALGDDDLQSFEWRVKGLSHSVPHRRDVIVVNRF